MKNLIVKILVVMLLLACGYKVYLKITDKPADETKQSENVAPITPDSSISYEVSKDGTKKNLSSDEDNLYVKSIEKENKKLSKKEENWDSNRVERDGEHRTSLSDSQIGELVIEKIAMKEPLYSGASELNLRRGGATVDYKEPLDEQTTAIAGHVGGKVHSFTNIKSLVKGDLIKIKDFKHKKTYVYKVKDTYTVSPSAREVLKDSKNKARKLVIITCHNYDLDKHYYTERWIVEAYEI